MDLAHKLASFVAEHASHTCIYLGDESFPVACNDRVGRVFEQRPELLFATANRFLVLFAVGNVTDHADHDATFGCVQKGLA